MSQWSSAGFRPQLWSYTPFIVRCGDRRDAADVLSTIDLHSLRGASVQHIKDCVQLKVLARFGGLFVDIDQRPIKHARSWSQLKPSAFFMASHLLRPLGSVMSPSSSDWADSNRSRAPAKRGRASLALVFVGSQAKPAARGAASKIFEQTAAKLDKLPWMDNTDVVAEAASVIMAPILFIPWPNWLLSPPGQILAIKKHGVSLPSIATVSQTSFTINLWERQWPPKMVKAVRGVTFS